MPLLLLSQVLFVESRITKLKKKCDRVLSLLYFLNSLILSSNLGPDKAYQRFKRFDRHRFNNFTQLVAASAMSLIFPLLSYRADCHR